MITAIENTPVTISTSKGTVMLRVCSKARYDEIERCIGESCAAICRKRLFEDYALTETEDEYYPCEDNEILKRYIGAVEEIIEKNGELFMIPTGSMIKRDRLPECALPCRTTALKIVAEHANISIMDAEALNYLVFRFLVADAVKYNMSATKEGIEKLNNAYSEMFEPFDRRAFIEGR